MFSNLDNQFVLYQPPDLIYFSIFNIKIFYVA